MREKKIPTVTKFIEQYRRKQKQHVSGFKKGGLKYQLKKKGRLVLYLNFLPFKTILRFGKRSYMALNMVNRGFVE
jgi:hypothetical protein